MARSWKSAIDQGLFDAPAREVRFVIGGSEIKPTLEFLGKHLVAVKCASSPRILGVLNYDQDGFGAGAEQLNFEPDNLESNQALVQRVDRLLNG